MQLTLVKNDTLFRLDLPEKCSGQYWVAYIDADGSTARLIGVEGIDGRWFLKSNRGAGVLDAEGKRIRDIEVAPDCFYEILIADTEERLLLRSEPTTEDRRRFTKLAVPENGKLVIGRTQEADILFASKFVSSHHVDLLVNNGAMSLVDAGSSNGTFLNGVKSDSAQLIPGDVLSVVGLTIVIGKGFIALNNPDGLVTFNEAALKVLERQKVEPVDDDEMEEASPGATFFRSPRFKRDITRAEIKIDAPPQLDTAEQMPLMMVLGPAATMGMASLFTGLFALNSVLSSGGKVSQAMPTLVMSFSMVIGMVLWPILTKRYEKRRKIEREAERQEKYKAYLEKTRGEIEAERGRQAEIMNSNVVTVGECVARIRSRERDLWERTIGHNDFLRVRLGMGDWPMDAEIKYAERHFSLDDDNLQDDMYSLAEEPRLLRDVPVSLSLVEQPILGIIGEREATKALLRGVIAQLVALHSYDELKLVFIYDEREAEDWEFARLLPHAWSDDRVVRFVATQSADVKELATYLDREFAKREAVSNDNELAELSPLYVVFALDKALAGKTDLIDKILKQKKNRGFSLVTLYDELRNLPKECRAVVEVEETQARIYDKDDITGRHVVFSPDIELEDDARELAQVLANTKLDTAAGAFSLPDMITFLELFGVGKVEHLNSLARWKESNPVLTLEAPVGVDSSGAPFKLDLHERYHGPHGLIAGMTGSGKSEFIMTYILSLAVNYHPNEVAFVLIDYKGGGMANSFAELPHVAGTITNLDGAAVNRALVSLQSELKRRQAIFNEASARTGTSNIDIYKYQSLYREGAVSEPLPHLLVISDEFAELKTQQPEFMSQLVSAARIGRSLGVHLILATQKPSGVVDDQIWSNSRFRVCLKVQERADSMEVIKRPDAAELAAVGRFFVQVGFNELFELGQSAWAGAPYYPADRVERAYDESVILINNLGQPIKQAKLDRRRVSLRNPTKQLDEITKYLAHLADEEHIATRPLWLEPIPEVIYLEDVRKRNEIAAATPFVLNPVIGEYDDPANQRQAALCVPVSEDGNLIVYGSAGSGKTSLVTTLIYSMIDTHTPAEVNLYLLDFEAETLSAFRDSPHVGDVLLSHESEKIVNLFKMLSEELERRKKAFSNFGGDYRSYITDSGEHVPSLVVVIHNYSAFSEMYDEQESVISYLTREGTKYGIYFVLTASSTSSVRFRILQNLKQLIVLQMNDSTEYAGILGNTQGVLPSPYRGRGLFRTDAVYEFQTAQIFSDAENVLGDLRAYCAEAAKKWTGHSARRVPILPPVVSSTYLAEEIGEAQTASMPVGIDRTSLSVVTYDFKKPFMTLVLSRANDDSTFLQGLAEAFAVRIARRATVLDGDGAFAADSDSTYTYVTEKPALNAAAVALFDEMVRRNNEAVDSRDSAAATPAFDEQVIVIPSMSALLSALTDENREKFTTMLEKCDASLGANFVFGEAAPNITSMIYERWAKEHVATNAGIWLGDGLSDQFTLQVTQVAGYDAYEQIGPGFGYLLKRGKPHLIKVLASSVSEGEADTGE